jgi:hypothetical protein
MTLLQKEEKKKKWFEKNNKEAMIGNIGWVSILWGFAL